jgi:hypothetical protein
LEAITSGTMVDESPFTRIFAYTTRLQQSMTNNNQRTTRTTSNYYNNNNHHNKTKQGNHHYINILFIVVQSFLLLAGTYPSSAQHFPAMQHLKLLRSITTIVRRLWL